MARAGPFCELALELASLFTGPIIDLIGGDHATNGVGFLVGESGPTRHFPMHLEELSILFPDTATFQVVFRSAPPIAAKLTR